MPNREDMAWFKQQFQNKIEPTIHNTPYTVNMLTALACQETGEVWPVLGKHQLSIDRILELCVGDTIDATPTGGRKAFPKTKAELISRPNGQQMFHIARQALVDMAQHINSYQKVAQKPNKFCHGFGIFQFDLQFFLSDPDYFLQKRYADFDACLAKCIGELNQALKRAGLQGKTTLTNLEMAAVAIAYNTGSFKPSLGLKQGFRSADGRFYGEQFFDFLRLAETVNIDEQGTVTLVVLPNGNAVIPPPTPVAATGNLFEVDVVSDPLRLRSEPKKDLGNPNANVIARLPDGHIVRAFTGKKINGFLEVETSLLGAHFQGFAAADLLKPATDVHEVPVLAPEPQAPQSGIVAVFMPRKTSTVTRRSGIADAFSLNEPGQPGRTGTTPDVLRTELAAIIDWLAVDKKTHIRYQPHDGLTFCNMYAHDYCFLAGVYLPRVWWTQPAIRELSQGQSVEPLLNRTIDGQKANDLFRWLRDFGLEFGWRQTGTLTKLQTEVNQGAIGLIVARRKEDGKSGHIVAVVPETDEFRSKRNTLGEVIAPLQSQAGRINFKYGTGNVNWWKDAQFAESAFWIHA